MTRRKSTVSKKATLRFTSEIKNTMVSDEEYESTENEEGDLSKVRL